MKNKIQLKRVEKVKYSLDTYHIQSLDRNGVERMIINILDGNIDVSVLGEITVKKIVGEIVNNSSSMNDRERVEWHERLNFMSKEQMIKLCRILLKEKDRLRAIDEKYGIEDNNIKLNKEQAKIFNKIEKQKSKELEKKRRSERKKLRKRIRQYKRQEVEKEIEIMRELLSKSEFEKYIKTAKWTTKFYYIHVIYVAINTKFHKTKFQLLLAKDRLETRFFSNQSKKIARGIINNYLREPFLFAPDCRKTKKMFRSLLLLKYPGVPFEIYRNEYSNTIEGLDFERFATLHQIEMIFVSTGVCKADFKYSSGLGVFRVLMAAYDESFRMKYYSSTNYSERQEAIVNFFFDYRKKRLELRKKNCSSCDKEGLKCEIIIPVGDYHFCENCVVIFSDY